MARQRPERPRSEELWPATHIERHRLGSSRPVAFSLVTHHPRGRGGEVQASRWPYSSGSVPFGRLSAIPADRISRARSAGLRSRGWPAGVCTTGQDLKPSTRRNDNIAYRLHIFPDLGDRPINAIKTMEVQAWYNAMRTKTGTRTGRPLSASMIHNTFVTLSKTFDFALRLDLISANPARRLCAQSRVERSAPTSTAPR